MRSLRAQNGLFCVLVGMLGVYASAFSAVADQMAGSFLASPAMAGLLVSVYAAGSLLSVLISGALADTVGKRKVVSFAMLIMTLGLVTVATAQSAAPLLIGLFLTGMGFGPTESMTSALLTDENPLEATKWMNLSQIAFGIGAIAAPVAAAWYLLTGGSFRGIMALCALLVAGLLALVLCSGKGQFAPPATARKAHDYNLFSVLKRPKVWVYALMVFLYLGYESVGPVYFKQYFLLRGATEQMATLAISVFWLAMLALRFAGVFLTGRELKCIRYLPLLAVVGTAVALSAQSDAMRMLGVVLYGFGCGPVWPMLFVLAAQACPGRSGATYAVMMLCSTAGNSLFPVLIGAWVGDPPVTLMICAGLAICVTATSLALQKRGAA
ncbi:MAG: MFS transporter [Clostridia bacterium]